MFRAGSFDSLAVLLHSTCLPDLDCIGSSNPRIDSVSEPQSVHTKCWEALKTPHSLIPWDGGQSASGVQQGDAKGNRVGALPFWNAR